MEVIVITSLIGLFLSYLDSRKAIKGGMLLGFLLISLIQSIRYDYGNDYMNYFRDFTMLESRDISVISNSMDEINMEPGWTILHFIFQYLGGFYVFIAFISFAQNIIYYSFIRKNVRREWWVLSFFIYAFTTTTGYLISMTMIRQSFAIALFLLAYPWFRDGKYWLSIPWVIILASIHQSAFVLLPFCFISCLKLRQSVIGYSLGILFIVLLFATQLLKDILLATFTLRSFERFEAYEDSEVGHLGLGVFIKTLPFIVTLFLFVKNKEFTKNERILVLLSCFYYLILPFAQVINLAERTGYYFLSLNVAVIPIVYGKLNGISRYLLIGLLVFLAIITYYGFFLNPLSVYAPYYLKYKTIF